jgi:hypothetical protein
MGTVESLPAIWYHTRERLEIPTAIVPVLRGFSRNVKQAGEANAESGGAPKARCLFCGHAQNKTH